MYSLQRFFLIYSIISNFGLNRHADLFCMTIFFPTVAVYSCFLPHYLKVIVSEIIQQLFPHLLVNSSVGEKPQSPTINGPSQSQNYESRADVSKSNHWNGNIFLCFSALFLCLKYIIFYLELYRKWNLSSKLCIFGILAVWRLKCLLLQVWNKSLDVIFFFPLRFQTFAYCKITVECIDPGSSFSLPLWQRGLSKASLFKTHELHSTD